MIKSSFLLIGGISFVIILVLSFAAIRLIAATFKKNNHLDNAANTAQGIVLAGKIIAALVLVAGIFPLIRDYVLVASAGEGLASGSSALFFFICCCGISFAYCVIALIEGMLSRQIFKGQSLQVELQENNLSLAIVRAVLIAGFAFVVLFSVGIFLQAFVPVPSIPSIR